MLLKFLSKYRDFGLLVMRLGLGVMFLLHGLPKLTGGPKVWKGVGSAMSNLGLDQFPEMWGLLAAITEGIGGMLLILGAFYRPTCLLLTFTMSSCDIIVGIFEAGAWTGIIGLVLGIALVIWLVSRFFGRGRHL